MPRKPKPMVIKGELKVPMELQPWERELLLPLVLEAAKEVFDGASDAGPSEPPKPTPHPAEEQFQEMCRQHGVTIESRQEAADGSVVFRCRVRSR